MRKLGVWIVFLISFFSIKSQTIVNPSGDNINKVYTDDFKITNITIVNLQTQEMFQFDTWSEMLVWVDQAPSGLYLLSYVWNGRPEKQIIKK